MTGHAKWTVRHPQDFYHDNNHKFLQENSRHQEQLREDEEENGVVVHDKYLVRGVFGVSVPCLLRLK